MLPTEIGQAAAYEAYRQITYNFASYSPLLSSFERRKEALMGMAVAEGAHRRVHIALQLYSQCIV